MVNRINVSCLSLPAVTVLDLDELKQVLQPMSRLEKLEFELGNYYNYIKPLVYYLHWRVEGTYNLCDKEY